ncbi:multiple sugar transport system permease protein [Kribbella sp. VKM Ac-2527]|uniref:Multiple sugar transport system permease protein n=1 Tax=Kribbella caucasensis TaxID=2512215 RepID=A0A4R6KJY6_9ACTN|nr:sugar ABC transporter permease [Kribbella sp. VKM Ac-2527]TDO51637.1 multiple sugar transport system permease protein [Kribbella sp. VKM Ac-2527]
MTISPAGTEHVVAGLHRPVRRRPRLTSVRVTMLLLVTPSAFLLLLITAYPLGYAAFQSVHDGTLITGGSYVGLSNYGNTLTSAAFWDAAKFTVVFTVVGVFGSWLVGLGLALLLRSKFPGRGLFKVLLLLPWVVPVVVSATSMNYLVATSSSPMPKLFHALGLGSPLFLADPTWAQVTVCVYKVWVSFPFMMLMVSAALSSIDETVYEAARVDGASSWQQFTGISLPMIARSTYISWILMTIFCVNDFPTIYLLTGGGPESSTTPLVVLAYRTVFQDFQVGPGVAIAFVMTLILVVVSTLLYRQIRKATYQ